MYAEGVGVGFGAKRRGGEMKDLIFKLKILVFMLMSEYRNWKEYVWEHDLDEYDCCGGNECMCGGQTIRDMWTPCFRKKTTALEENKK